MELSDGVLVFSVNNGAGPETVTFVPDQKRQLCDGHWHHIKVIVIILDIISPCKLLGLSFYHKATCIHTYCNKLFS